MANIVKFVWVQSRDACLSLELVFVGTECNSALTVWRHSRAVGLFMR